MDTTNELQQSLLDTMNLISSKLADSTNAPVTIKAEIVEQLDSGTRLYSIKYGGTVYKDAYAISSVTYEPSTMVFVLVPDNNFDNTKMILNAVIPSADEEADEELTDIRVPVSDNIILSNQDNLNSIDLQSWKDKEYGDILQETEGFNAVISNYLSKYKTLLFSAKIKTEIDIDHQAKGNYGLKLILPFVQKDTSKEEGEIKVTKEFIMDVSNMMGNPYNYQVYQNVGLYFDIDDTLTYDTTGTPHIYPFTRDFGYTEIPIEIDSDIHIKDISIEVIETIPAADTQGYYLTLKSDNGYYFLNGSSYNTETKTITPILRVNGKKTNCSSYECYWFVEDSSIDTTSEDYFRPGGLGWRCLNEKINESTDDTGKKTFQYVTNVYSLEVKAKDVVSILRYKCLIMKKDISVSATIELKNLNKPPQITLKTDSGTNTYIENIGEAYLIARVDNPNPIVNDTPILYTTSWQLFDKDGNYKGNSFYSIEDEITDPDSKFYELHIKFPVTEIEKVSTINCTFYQTYDRNSDPEITDLVTQTIGTSSIMLRTASNVNYIVSIVGGDKLYKYDSEGDSPMIADYDGPASSKLTACEPLTFKVFKADGKEFTQAEYAHCNFKWTFPKTDTMLVLKSPEASSQDEDYYYITGIGNTTNLEYKMRDTYKKEYTNNTIFLSLTIGEQETVETSTIIQFTKDGAGGTNGSKYSAIIEYKDFPYKAKDTNNQSRKFQAIYVQTNTEGSDLDSGTWYGYEQSQYETDPDTKEKKYILKPLSECESFTLAVFSNEIKLQNPVGGTPYYTVSWSMFDDYETNPFFSISSSGKLSERIVGNIDYSKWKHVDLSRPIEDEDKEIRCNIVQATVHITGNVETGDLAEEVLYTYYPIEIARVLPSAIEKVTKEGKTTVYMKGIIPSMEGGYEEILYASDGSNPYWSRGTDFRCVDSIYNNDANLEYEWTTSSNLIRKDKNNKTATDQISPRTKFEHNITNNYVKVDLNLTTEKETELNTQKATLEETIATNLQERDNQEELRAGVLNMVNVLSFNNYKTLYLDNCKNLLKHRYQLLNSLTELKKQLDDAVNYSKKMARNRTSTSYSNFILIQKQKDYNEIIDTYYKDVYRLKVAGTAEGDDKMKLLPDMKITNNSTDRFYTNTSFVTKWNQAVTDYNVLVTSYNAFIEKDKKVELSELSNFRELISAISAMPNVVPNYVGVTLLNVFNLLKTSIVLLANYAVNPEGKIDSYTAFENLLKTIAFTVRTYSTNPQYNEAGKLTDTDYTIKIYGKIISSLNNANSNAQKQIDEIDRIFNLGTKLIYVKPILMHMNAAEMSYLRGWDGHKLYTGQKNNGQEEFLFAPQVGAGKMVRNETTGAYALTGMVMGVRTFDKNQKSHVGMFGYDEGYQTMFLNAEDGSAIFGKSGSGQIIIDPSRNRGLIYSASYFYDKDKPSDNPYGPDGKPTNYGRVGIGNQGMLINLGNTNLDDTPFIHFGDEKGYIYSGEHKTFEDNYKPGFYLSKRGLSIGSTIRISSNKGDNDFGTVEVGYLKDGGKHWIIKGYGNSVDASKSYIGYHVVNDDSGFQSKNGTFYYHNRIGTYNSESYHEKEIKYSYLEATEKAVQKSVYIGTDGIRLGKGSIINDEGNASFTGHIEAISGMIGGWSIIGDTLIGHVAMDKATEKDVWKNKGYMVIDADEGIYFSKKADRGERWWKLKPDGSMYVDSPNSCFGGVKIEDEGEDFKCTHYESQKPVNVSSDRAGVFQLNCFEEIKGIAKSQVHKVAVVDGYNGDTPGNTIGYVWCP